MINEVNEKEILWAGLEEDVIIPTKEDENADYDIYAYFEGGYLIIQPHETRMIPTGLYVALNKKWKLVLEERGSTGTKGIGQRCGEVDSGFRGEIFVPITNHNNKPLIIIKSYVEQPSYLKELAVIYPYEKAICQAGVVEVPVLESKIISVEELKLIPSKRKESCLGDSGK
jgi:dUTP pyrophosphatase